MVSMTKEELNDLGNEEILELLEKKTISLNDLENEKIIELLEEKKISLDDLEGTRFYGNYDFVMEIRDNENILDEYNYEVSRIYFDVQESYSNFTILGVDYFHWGTGEVNEEHITQAMAEEQILMGFHTLIENYNYVTEYKKGYLVKNYDHDEMLDKNEWYYIDYEIYVDYINDSGTGRDLELEKYGLDDLKNEKVLELLKEKTISLGDLENEKIIELLEEKKISFDDLLENDLVEYLLDDLENEKVRELLEKKIISLDDLEGTRFYDLASDEEEQSLNESPTMSM